MAVRRGGLCFTPENYLTLSLAIIFESFPHKISTIFSNGRKTGTGTKITKLYKIKTLRRFYLAERFGLCENVTGWTDSWVGDEPKCRVVDPFYVRNSGPQFYNP